MAILLDQRPPGEGSTDPGKETVDGGIDWLALAREAFSSSTNYIDANYRKRWEDSIAAFNSKHAADSKYNTSAYDKRSRLFRPKTRSIVRKTEAAGAAAFFSNLDVVSIEARNQSDKRALASADILKHLLQYRLTASPSAGGVPWFQIAMGGLQDGQVSGAAAAHVYWCYKERRITVPAQKNEAGEEVLPAQSVGKPIEDRPVVDLIPIENLRIDPAASWVDPIGTSPYVIHMIPMHAGDVRAKMRENDPKTGQPAWKTYGEAFIRAAATMEPDTTRMQRNDGREDPAANMQRTIGHYEVVWIQRHIHRRDGEDWEFYTLGDQALLTQPRKLAESVLHGIRPYVLGTVILETHKALPSSKAELIAPLQAEANEIVNQRIDNVKFVLNKRWIVKRGKQVDATSLVRNVPGAVTMADDPDGDVRELNWPDVTASAYMEQDRINVDMDELAGNFSAGSVQTNRQLNETVGGMRILAGASNIITEYELLTFALTFVAPILRQLVKLEQAYETDQVILAIAAERAQLLQRYGIDRVTDDMLQGELNVTVNVGMGATDPVAKQQRLGQALAMYTTVAMQPPPGLNIEEVAKEIFAFAGYQDGRRFLTANPQVAAMEQQLQQMQAMLAQMQQQIDSKQGDQQVTLAVADQNNTTKLALETMRQERETVRSIAQARQASQNKPQQSAGVGR